MAKYVRSREGKSKRDSRSSHSRRDSRGKRNFNDSPKERRGSGREYNSYSRNRRDSKMTKVTCSSCSAECEVPFKPTSNKPVYCNECFSKKNQASSNRPSEMDLDIINEKLNKIMKALDIK